MRGGRTAAILASLTSTCRRHDIDPQLYLTQLLTNLSLAPDGDLSAWLPDSKRPDLLSITHKLHSDHDAQFYVGEGRIRRYGGRLIRRSLVKTLGTERRFSAAWREQ